MKQPPGSDIQEVWLYGDDVFPSRESAQAAAREAGDRYPMIGYGHIIVPRGGDRGSVS